MLTALNILVKLGIAATHLLFAVLLPQCMPFDPIYSHSPFYLLYYVVIAASGVSFMMYVAFAFEAYFDPRCFITNGDKVTVTVWLTMTALLYTLLFVHMMVRHDHIRPMFLMAFTTFLCIMLWAANTAMLLLIKE